MNIELKNVPIIPGIKQIKIVNILKYANNKFQKLIILLR